MLEIHQSTQNEKPEGGKKVWVAAPGATEFVLNTTGEIVAHIKAIAPDGEYRQEGPLSQS